MRWKAIRRKRYEEGFERIKSKFLIIPKRVDDEWRWLEKASWLQSYEYIDTEIYSNGKSRDIYGFVDISWIDNNYKGDKEDGNSR